MDVVLTLIWPIYFLLVCIPLGKSKDKVCNWTMEREGLGYLIEIVYTTGLCQAHGFPLLIFTCQEDYFLMLIQNECLVSLPPGIFSLLGVEVTPAFFWNITQPFTHTHTKTENKNVKENQTEPGWIPFCHAEPPDSVKSLNSVESGQGKYSGW